MYGYNLTEWLFIFYFYCFFGWCFESTYVSIKMCKFVNRGFLRGPFLPIYGSGAIVMLVVSVPFKENLVGVYLAGAVGATVLEYVTGVAMEALFRVRYWDYSNQRFNFQGHICLSSTLAWGVFTVLMTVFIHPPVERFVLGISNQVLTVVTLLLTAYICGDFALSFKAALDLRDALYRMEKVKTEMIHIQKRLDVMIALTGEDISNFKEEYEERSAKWREEWSEGLGSRIEDVKQGVEERLGRVMEPIGRWKDETADNSNREFARKEWEELKERYKRLVDRRESLSKVRDHFQRKLILANPSMYSARFGEALEELKRHVSEKIESPDDEDNE